MNKSKHSFDERFEIITDGVNILYVYLHLLKGYTEMEGTSNNEVAIIDIFMDNIIEEIDKISSCV